MSDKVLGSSIPLYIFPPKRKVEAIDEITFINICGSLARLH